MDHPLRGLLAFFRLLSIPPGIYLMAIAGSSNLNMAIHKPVMVWLGLFCLLCWIATTLLTKLILDNPVCGICNGCIEKGSDEDEEDSPCCTGVDVLV